MSIACVVQVTKFEIDIDDIYDILKGLTISNLGRESSFSDRRFRGFPYSSSTFWNNAFY